MPTTSLRHAPNPTYALQAPPTLPVLHFVVYAWIPPALSFEALGYLPGRWEQVTGLFPSPDGATALCQWLWDHDKSRTYRIFWNLGPKTKLTQMAGPDRSGSQWFDDLGCYHLGWWAGIDWDALYKGPK